MILQWTRGNADCYVGRTDSLTIQVWRGEDRRFAFRVRPDIFEGLQELHAKTMGQAKTEVERIVGERVRQLAGPFIVDPRPDDVERTYREWVAAHGGPN